MTLASGARLGPYEILSPLGAGGMGEVYKAKDTRLERTVAVKVLPQRLSSSPEVRQRFEREAKTISQLSHAHICALYDVGSEGDVEYLVMEYLEGETLLDRLAKGPLSPEQTLRYGGEIADALDKAHRQGIVHRDLKPGNVMLTKSGVKLLDFGLAKAIGPPPSQGSLTALPTQQGLTQEGTILGTFQYMAPEQLEGKDADARTDIFAFGATLYEMATGKKAFSGTTQASLIGAILHTEPAPISQGQPASPPALDRVVKTCLAKDPDERWQSAADIKRELRWIAEGSGSGVSAPPTARRRGRNLLPWAIAALAVLVAAGLAIRSRRPAAAASEPMLLSIVPPQRTILTDSMEISPDGRKLAFVGISGGKSMLRIRDLGSDDVQTVAGTETAESVFWSPDSRFVGFYSRGKLRRVELATGSIEVLCDAELGRGGSWGSKGDILFTPKTMGIDLPRGGVRRHPRSGRTSGAGRHHATLAVHAPRRAALPFLGEDGQGRNDGDLPRFARQSGAEVPSAQRSRRPIPAARYGRVRSGRGAAGAAFRPGSRRAAGRPGGRDPPGHAGRRGLLSGSLLGLTQRNPRLSSGERRPAARVGGPAGQRRQGGRSGRHHHERERLLRQQVGGVHAPTVGDRPPNRLDARPREGRRHALRGSELDAGLGRRRGKHLLSIGREDIRAASEVSP